MIIGGQAVLIHGRPRMTEDVDVTLGIDVDDFERLLEVCRPLGLTAIPENPRHFAEEKRVLPTQESHAKVRVDFIFSITPYERQAIQRAKKVPMAGYPVRFASAEDLLIHKVFAGRAIDLEDAKEVLLRHRGQLDRAYIRKWLKMLDTSEDGRDLLTVWKQLCKEI